jgi:8-oxo-dGTP pyrophosphatase MutT (NUDIX family)
MALPGGRREPEDPDLLATAIRETAEEVGVLLQKDNLAGALEDVVPRTPRLPPIAIRPFVFLVPRRPPMRINAEVADASWVPLDYLLRPGTHHSVHLEVSGQSRQVQAFELENAIVWGLTERILSNFLSELQV